MEEKHRIRPRNKWSSEGRSQFGIFLTICFTVLVGWAVDNIMLWTLIGVGWGLFFGLTLAVELTRPKRYSRNLRL